MLVVGTVTLGFAGELGEAFPAKPVGRVTAFTGLAVVRRLGGSVQPLRVGGALFRGDIIEVPQSGVARLRLRGGFTVTVRELSRLEVGRDTPGTPVLGPLATRGRSAVASVRG